MDEIDTDDRHEFSEGDEAVVVDDDLVECGETVVIDDIDPDREWSVWASIQSDEYNDVGSAYYEHDLEPVESDDDSDELKFSEGDEVRIVNENYPENGETAVITDIFPNLNRQYTASLSGQKSVDEDIYKEEDLELVESDEEVSERTVYDAFTDDTQSRDEAFESLLRECKGSLKALSVSCDDAQQSEQLIDAYYQTSRVLDEVEDS